MAKGQDLLKYITERVVAYMETPKEVRKERVQHYREPWQSRWFGMLPIALQLWMDTKRKPKKTPPSNT